MIKKYFEIEDFNGDKYYPYTYASIVKMNSGENLEKELSKRTYKLVDDFGAKGDGITDDSLAINKAMDWSRENKKPIYFLDKKYYVKKSINISNAILRSVSNKPGYGDLLFLQKYDGSYFSGSPDWSYLFNLNSSITWRDVIDEVVYGCCIISDSDINILRCNNNAVIDIEGIGIIGNHKAINQKGITDEIPNKYVGNKHNIKNVNVLGCGNNGINLFRGFEVSRIENVRSSFNMGHGLYTGYNSGIDSATEYLSFIDCVFAHNRLDGVHFSYWRKDINFSGCNFNGNGQYYINGIDPILGYDRRLPETLKQVHSGVWFNRGNIELNNTNIGLSFKNCYGEDLLKGVHLENIEGIGVVNSVIFENNIFYQGNMPSSNNWKGTCFYVNVNYITNWTVKGNYGNALEPIYFEKNPLDGGNNIFNDIDKVPLMYNQDLMSNKNIISKKRIYGESTLFKDVEGNGTNINLSDIKNDFNLIALSGQSNKISSYILSAHWQSNNSDNFGGYLLVVTILPSAKYKMITLPLDSVEGFSTKPSLLTDGTLIIPTQQYYRYTLTRLDNNKTV